MNQKINELKVRINELQQNIKDIQEIKDQTEEKKEIIRKITLINVCIAGVGHLILGPLINPVISLASLIFLSLSVIPGGITILHYESKIDRYQKQIDDSNLEIINCQNGINSLLGERLYDIPVKSSQPINTKEPILKKITKDKSNKR